MDRLLRRTISPAAVRLAALATLAALASCSVAPPRRPPPAPPPAPHYTTPLSRATTVGQYERVIARSVQRASATEVYAGRPQFFLRAVIVYQVQIDAAGRVTRVDLFRAPDKPGVAQLVRRARESVFRAAPFARPGPQLLGRYGTVAVMETWLFDSDGRFRLRAASNGQETGAQALEQIDVGVAMRRRHRR